MGNYNYEYKKYYQELQNKNSRGTYSPVYKNIGFEDSYGGCKRKIEKKDFFSSMTNVFIYQLVVVSFMLMATFYLKYSPQQVEHYENIKAVINNDVYTEKDSSFESFNTSSIMKKIRDYIKLNLNGEKADF